MFTFLSLIPFILLMLLAQLGRRHSTLAALVYGLLVFLNALLVAAGASLFLAGKLGLFAIPEAQLQDMMFVGKTVLVTGVVATLVLLPPVQRLLHLFMPFRVGDVVHATALAYASYLLGLTLAQTPLLRAVEEMTEPMSLPPSELWGQALGMTLLAFVGVGVGLGRSWHQTTRRLGLIWPRWRDLSTALAGMMFLVFIQSALGAVWMAFAPDSFERVSRISEILLGQLLNPLGALVVGITAGVGEELVFRGALQPRFGLLVTSLLFASVHVQYAFSFALAIVFLLGLVLGLIRKHANTTAAILTHALYNATLVLLATYGPDWVP